MQKTGATDDLRFLAPEECVWWGAETEDDDKWRRLTLHRGAKGARERFWHIDHLSEAMLLAMFGAGTYRLLFFRQSRRAQLGTSRPFVIDAVDDDPPSTARSAADDIPMAPTVERPGPLPVDFRIPEAADALSNLTGEQLAAVLQGRPADTSPEGVGMALLERINRLYLSMQGGLFQQMKQEASLQLARAQAEIELVRVTERARADATIEQSRMFFKAMQDASERAQRIEAEAREEGQGDELATMRETLQALVEHMTHPQEGPGQITPAQEDALSALIRNAGPEVIKAIAARFLHGGGQAAAAAAQAQGYGIGEVIDAVTGD